MKTGGKGFQEGTIATRNSSLVRGKNRGKRLPPQNRTPDGNRVLTVLLPMAAPHLPTGPQGGRRTGGGSDIPPEPSTREGGPCYSPVIVPWINTEKHRQRKALATPMAQAAFLLFNPPSPAGIQGLPGAVGELQKTRARPRKSPTLYREGGHARHSQY